MKHAFVEQVRHPRHVLAVVGTVFVVLLVLYLAGAGVPTLVSHPVAYKFGFLIAVALAWLAWLASRGRHA